MLYDIEKIATAAKTLAIIATIISSVSLLGVIGLVYYAIKTSKIMTNPDIKTVAKK